MHSGNDLPGASTSISTVGRTLRNKLLAEVPWLLSVLSAGLLGDSGRPSGRWRQCAGSYPSAVQAQGDALKAFVWP